MMAKGAAWTLGWFLVIRAIAEPFVIDLADPTAYQNDWGGPSLAGVLTVHCLPGVLAGVAMVRTWRRRRRQRPAQAPSNT